LNILFEATREMKFHFMPHEKPSFVEEASNPSEGFLRNSATTTKRSRNAMRSMGWTVLSYL
jgi:hypothetical protein